MNGRDRADTAYGAHIPCSHQMKKKSLKFLAVIRRLVHCSNAGTMRDEARPIHDAMGLHIELYDVMLRAVHSTFSFYFRFRYTDDVRFALDDMFSFFTQMIAGRDSKMSHFEARVPPKRPLPKNPSIGSKHGQRVDVLEVDTNVLYQYKTFLYVSHAKIVVNGYLHRLGMIPSDLKALCMDFYYEKMDGVYQIAFKLYSLLNRAKKHCFTKFIAISIIKKYLNLQRDEDAEIYCAELLRMKCIVSLNEDRTRNLLQKNGFKILSEPSTAYFIPKTRKLEFSQYIH